MKDGSRDHLSGRSTLITKPTRRDLGGNEKSYPKLSRSLHHGPVQRPRFIHCKQDHGDLMPADTPIELPDGVVLKGFLEGEPEVGTVVFAHGSGSGRHSPRNRHVAEVLQGSGMQTLLLDLLTPEEEQVDMATREHRFDIDLLSRRVVGAIDWLPEESPVGVFGASTGAAAALRAAAE